MDGVLMEWEKMLPDPNEIDDLDQADMLENDLPIFEEKNQSSGIFSTEKAITREITQENLSSKEANKISESADKSDFVHPIEPEDSETTLKLIDELNASDVITAKSPFQQEKGCHDSILNKDIVEIGQQAKNNNKLVDAFENCMDSPIQISDVRTGDIPLPETENVDESSILDKLKSLSEADNSENEEPPKSTLLSKFTDKSYEKQELSLDTILFSKLTEKSTAKQETSLEANIRKGYIQLENGEEMPDIHPKQPIEEEDSHKKLQPKRKDRSDDSNPSLLNKDVTSKLFAHLKKRISVTEENIEKNTTKNATTDSQQPDEVYQKDIESNGEITQEKSDMNREENGNNQIMATSNSDTTNTCRTLVGDLESKEGEYTLLTVKQEPMDYEEYGKVQEHESTPQDYEADYVAEFGRIAAMELDYNESADYVMTHNGFYQCKYCYAKLSDYSQFQNHLAERHKTYYQCKHCNQYFMRSQELAIHCRMAHSNLETKSKDTKTYVKHIKSQNTTRVKKKKSTVCYDSDGNPLYKCAYCSKKFRVQQAMASHVGNVHTNKEYRKSKVDPDMKKFYFCKFCDEGFEKLREMKFHIKTVHPEHFQKKISKYRKKPAEYDSEGNQIYKCTHCDEVFRVQQSMASHMKIHKSRDNAKWSKANPDQQLQEEKAFDPEPIKHTTEKVNGEENDNKCESSPVEIQTQSLPYRNISFESDSNGIEENLANIDCSLKRELKSSQIYHCSKCPKWFYREKQVLNHEKICTGIKLEADLSECSQQSAEIVVPLYNKDMSRQEYLKRLKEFRSKSNQETKLQNELAQKIKGKILQKKKKSSEKRNFLPKSSEVKLKLDLPRFFCKYCPSSREEGKTMNLHLVKHLGDVRQRNNHYICCICKSVFPSSRKIFFHLQRHADFEIKYLYEKTSIPECSICGQPFLNKQLLEKHENKHRNITDSKVDQKSSGWTTILHNKTGSKLEMKKIGSQTVVKTLSLYKDPQSQGSQNVPKTQSPYPHPKGLSSNTKLVNEGQITYNRVPVAKQTGSVSIDSTSTSGGAITATKTLDSTYSTENNLNHKMIDLNELSCHSKHNTVSLDDIPFQCGMCLSRFPNSQFLLHHITLHMQGPYVFKIHVDKKPNEMEENNEKIPSASPVSLLAPNKIGNQLSTQVTDFQTNGGAPLILNMPDLKKAQNNGLANGRKVILLGTDSDATINAIANDHVYSNSSRIKQKKDQFSEEGASDTDSAVTTDDESPAYYDTDECEEIENEIAHQANTQDTPILKSILKKSSGLKSAQRVPNFKKCLDIANGKWYECPHCLHLSHNERDFNVHMKNHCGLTDKMVVCSVCDRKFVSHWHLSKHVNQQHRQNSYKCAFCDEGFKTAARVTEHMQKMHRS